MSTGKKSKKGNGTDYEGYNYTGDLSPVAQAMVQAATYGPTGYDEAMMKNLGLDVPIAGVNGGGRSTSGMTETMGSTFGAPTAPVTPDPLAAILPPQGPATPITVNDLAMKYRATGGPSSSSDRNR